MIDLYHAPQSTCSQKVRICLAEKGLEWIDHRVNLAKNENLTPEYLALNPNGVVPTLVHDGEPIIDSSVICEYLDEVFPVNSTTPPDALGRTVGGVPAIFKEFTKEAGLDYDVSLETVGGKGFDYHYAEKRAVLDKPWDVVVGHGYSTLDEAHPGNPAQALRGINPSLKIVNGTGAPVNPVIIK